MYAFERITQPVLAHIADLQLVIAVRQLYRALGGIRCRAAVIVGYSQSARQHLYRFKIVYVYAQTEYTEKIVHVKTAHAYLVCAAKTEAHRVFYIVRLARRH